MKKRTSKQIFAETFLDLSRELPVDKITVKKIVEESGLSLKTFSSIQQRKVFDEWHSYAATDWKP